MCCISDRQVKVGCLLSYGDWMLAMVAKLIIMTQWVSLSRGWRWRRDMSNTCSNIGSKIQVSFSGGCNTDSADPNDALLVHSSSECGPLTALETLIYTSWHPNTSFLCSTSGPPGVLRMEGLCLLIIPVLSEACMKVIAAASVSPCCWWDLPCF